MLLAAEHTLVAGKPRAGVVLEINDRGLITQVGDAGQLGAPRRKLAGRLLIPGLVEAHVDVLAGLPRATIGAADLRIAARRIFTELLLCGVTSVGALLTVHRAEGGRSYVDPSAMPDSVALAAGDTGIRMCLLRSVRMRGDFERRAEGEELREWDPNVEVAAERIAHAWRRVTMLGPRLTCGLAVESLAAISPDDLVALKTRLTHLPLHMGAARDPAEILACQTLYDARPVELLVQAGVVDACTTLVGAHQLSPVELNLASYSGGVVSRPPAQPAAKTSVAELEAAGISVAVSPTTGGSALRLDRFSRAGACALAQPAGRIAKGHWADLVAVDVDWLENPALPLPVREVWVGGEVVVADGRHQRAPQAGLLPQSMLP